MRSQSLTHLFQFPKFCECVYGLRSVLQEILDKRRADLATRYDLIDAIVLQFELILPYYPLGLIKNLAF